MAPKPFPPIDVLRATLHKVEQESGLAPDDPALLELKRIVLNRITEIQLAKPALAGDEGDPAQPRLDPALEPHVESSDVTPLLAQSAPELPNPSLDTALTDKLR